MALKAIIPPEKSDDKILLEPSLNLGNSNASLNDSDANNLFIDKITNLSLQNQEPIQLTNSSLQNQESIQLNIFINELIALIIKKDKGIEFDQIKQFIIQQIFTKNQSTDEIIKWLSNQNESQYIWLRGFFYYYSIGIKENTDEAFKLFLKAAEDNYSIAQVYLAKCYEFGIGIDIDESKAFEWYEKTAIQGNSNAQYKLGYLYQKGIGIERDLEKAFDWYQKAAKNENEIAQYKLVYLYQKGIGIEKDLEKAFKWCEKSANQEYSNAQYDLGVFYENGIGIEKKYRESNLLVSKIGKK